MADNLITFTLSPASLQAFAEKFKHDKEERIKQALGEIKREWQQEFVRQDIRMQKVWTPLKTWVSHRSGKASKQIMVGAGIDPKSYAARKKRAYFGGKSRKGAVRYLRILKRTGVMLQRYINGIYIDDVHFGVTIPFPDPPVKQRAKSHQGRGVGLPFGVLSTRKYDLDRFIFTADREIRRALSRA